MSTSKSSVEIQENTTPTYSVPVGHFPYPATQSWKQKYGDPAPLAYAGLIMTLTPLSCQLMTWRGADGSGSANNGVHYYCGGVLLILAGLLQFFRGETFAFVVYSSYGGFFTALGATLEPVNGALAAYITTTGEVKPSFYSSFGFFFLWTGVLSFVYLICSLRTNFCLVMVFLVYSIALPTIAASFWAAGQGKGDMALKLQIIGGAECFVVSAFLWYLFVGAMLESVKFPVSLPTGDLSRFWGSSEAVDEEKAKSR